MGRAAFLLGSLLPIVFASEAQTSSSSNTAQCEQDPRCQDSLTAALSDFTESLYADIASRTTHDNFVFSPLSIHSALALLYAGSTPNSKTHVELRNALGYIASQPVIETKYKRLIKSFENQQSFLYANSIWAQDGFTIKKNFTREIRENFGAETKTIDFTKESSVEEINSWISDRTKGLIPTLVQGFPSTTRMFLANALYFKDRWLVPFQEKNESGDPLDRESFYGKSKLNVPMMLTNNVNIEVGSLNFGSHNATFVNIPYINDQFEMQIILPAGKRDGKGLEILEDFISKNVKREKHNVRNIFLSPKEVFENVEDVRLKMPKFSVSTKFDASKHLKSLGVNQLFQEAELVKFGEGAPLAVSKILHKAVVNVDKEGTEGAAATGVELVLLSGSFGRNIDVNVDQPFIFIVQDKKNNIPILVGRIKNPLK